jgi:hypothetical protein
VKYYVYTSKKITYKTHFVTPLFAAIMNNNFEIADILMSKGAKINYNLSYGSPLFSHLSGALNQENILYIMKHGYRNYLYLLLNWIENEEWNEEFLNFIIFQIMLRIHRFIPTMLNFYKRKIPLSNEQINNIMYKEKITILNDYKSLLYDYALERKRYVKKEILLKYITNVTEKDQTPKASLNTDYDDTDNDYNYFSDYDDLRPNVIKRIPY